MKLRLNRACQLAIIISGITLVSGCAHTPQLVIDSQENHKEKESIADKMQNICAIPESDSPNNNYWELRYIRAQFLLAAITRYGAARIEDYYGGEQDIRGAYLLAKVNDAAKAIKKASDRNSDPIPLHKVDLADVTNDLLRTVAAAMKATSDRLKNFALAPNFAGGRDFLTNAMEDALYIKAYREDCASLMEAGKDANKISEIKKTVNKHLVEQCDRVEKMSGLKHDCKF